MEGVFFRRKNQITLFFSSFEQKVSEWVVITASYVFTATFEDWFKCWKNYVFTFNFALWAGIFQTAGEKFLRVGGNCMLLVQRKLLTANKFFDWMFLFKKCFGAQTKLFKDSVTKFLGISVQIVSTCPWQRSDKIYTFWQKVINTYIFVTAVKNVFGLLAELFHQGGENFFHVYRQTKEEFLSLTKIVLPFIFGVWALTILMFVKTDSLMSRKVFRSGSFFLKLNNPISIVGLWTMNVRTFRLKFLPVCQISILRL